MTNAATAATASRAVIRPRRVPPNELIGNGIRYRGIIEKHNIGERGRFAFLSNITCPSDPKAPLPSGGIFIHIKEINRDGNATFASGAAYDFLIMAGRKNRPCAELVTPVK